MPTTFEVPVGEHIERTALRATALAVQTGEPVTFEFNGITLNVAPGMTADAVLGKYKRRQDEASEAYRNSPEGRTAAQAAKTAAIRAQEAVAACLAELRFVVPGQPATTRALMHWLRRFLPAANHISVNVDVRALADRFATWGFVESAFVGTDPDALRADEDNYARYVIGQVMSCWRSAGAVPGIAEVFIERWFAAFPDADTGGG